MSRLVIINLVKYWWCWNSSFFFIHFFDSFYRMGYCFKFCPSWSCSRIQNWDREWSWKIKYHWKYTILADLIRSWLRVYDHRWKVYDPSRKIIWSFSENMRSFIWNYTIIRDFLIVYFRFGDPKFIEMIVGIVVK